MICIIFLFGLILSLGACGQHAEKPELPENLSQDIKDAYDNDQAILLYYFTPKTKGTEAYADWSAYLDDFKRSLGADFYIRSFDISELRSLVKNTSSVEDFSLFLKDGHPTYLYPDVILEPQVYRAVFHSYSGQPITDEDRAFMPEKVDL